MKQICTFILPVVMGMFIVFSNQSDHPMVERANNALNLATNVEPSKRCVTYMPILDVNYLGESFNKSNSTNMESSGTNNTICKEFQF